MTNKSIESLIIPGDISKRDLDRTINRDYAGLLSGSYLDCNGQFRSDLLKRSIRGHASEGHARFKGIKGIPNMTDEYIASVLGDPEKIKQRSQENINKIFAFVKRMINGENIKTLADKNGKPLFGISFFENLKIEKPENVLKGVVYGARWDNYKWRNFLENEWGVKLGGGHGYPVDLFVMDGLGYDLKKLAGKTEEGEKSIGLEDKLNFFKEKGLIKKPNSKSSTNIVDAYIRMKPGMGISDNLGYLNAGLLLGTDGLIGAFFADAIDTLDKFTPRIAEQDEKLLRLIEKNEKEIKKAYLDFSLPTKEETMDFIYVVMHNKKARVNPVSLNKERNKGHKLELPDNSLRYLLQIGPSGKCNLKDHLDFVGDVYAGIKWQDYVKGCQGIQLLNHDKTIRNKLLYEYIADRLDTVKKMRQRKNQGLLAKEIIEQYNKGKISNRFF